MDKDNDGRFPEVPLVPSGQVARGSCLLSSIWWSFPVRSNSGYDACGSARQHLQHALGIFESLPAPLWVQRARSELSRVGLRPPAPLALTATEERVAGLAASGRTNRQVAQALFLSPRTVEANLARVYRKLGVSSRAELGAAMARKELGPPLP